MTKAGRLSVPILGLLLIGGCAWLQQARQDYQTGKDIPLAEGEQSPGEAAERLLEPVKSLPYGNVAFPILVTIVGYIGTYQRGKRIRKNLPISSNPITGDIGSRVGLETLVQHLSTLAAGIFEVGPNGSGFKRGWKVAAATGIAGSLLLIPQVKDVFAQNAESIAIWLGGVATIVAILEKELSRVLPVKEPTSG